MNAIYRIVWNAVTGRWVVASELAKGRKKGGSKRAAVGALLAAGLLGSLAMSHAAYAANGGSLNLCAEDNTGAALGTSGTPAALGSCSANTYDWGLFSDSAPNGGTGGTNQTSLTGNKDGTMSFYAANGLKMLSTLSMSGQKITNLANGTAASDAATFGQLQAVSTQATNTNRYFKAVGANDGTDDASAVGGAVASGVKAAATGSGSVAVGSNSIANGAFGTAAGNAAIAAGNYATALGVNANASGDYSVVLGLNAKGSGAQSVAAGYNASASGLISTALGNGSSAAGDRSVAMGSGASVVAGTSQSMALGRLSKTTADNAVALGAGSIADRANTISVGAAGTERQIVNVADGTLAAASKDAVNGSQLFATNQNVAQNTSDIAGNTASISNLDNRVTTNEGDIGTLNTNVSNIDARVTQNTSNISSLDGRVTNVEGNIGNITNQINNGSVGMVQQASAGADLTVGKSTDGAAVDFADQGGNARSLKNIKAGVNDHDAVNMSQLNATNAAVTQNTTSISSLDQRVTTNEGDISTINTNVGNIDARVTQNTTDITSLDKRVTTNEGDIGTINTNVSNIDARVTQNTSNIASLDGRVTNVEGSISNFTNQINNGSVGMVQQASAGADLTVGSATDGAAVSFADKSGNARTLKNVKAGVGDNDAVNMSQLNATNAAVTQNTTSISSLDQRVTTNEGDIGTINTNVSNIDARVTQNASSISSLDGRVTNVEGNVSSLTNQISNGEVGLVKQDASSKVVTVAKDTGGKRVDMSGTDGERTVTGVAEGDVSASSKDAVNGSQLFATNQQVAQNTAAIAGNTASIAGLSQSINNITTGGNGVKFFHANSAAADSVASGQESVAMGGGAQATVKQSVALGSGSVADRDNSVSVGSQGHERQITNVRAGTADTDAVNVAQLKAAGVINGDGSANAAVTYDRNADGSTNHGSVTLGNGQAAGGTAIHNVAAGVSEMDAVNVGQLNAVVSKAASTSNTIASNDAGTSAAKATGKHSTAIGGGSAATGDNSVAIGAGSVADRDNTVSVGSQGNERQITNVKAGTADTDAVNVAQMNQASSSATSSANSYTDQQVGNVAKQVAGMQQQMDDQFRNVNKRISGGNAMSTSMMTMAASLGGIETQNRFGAGTGFSNGSKAISVGYQRAISKRANITVGASVTGGDSSVGVGVGMGW